MINRPGAKPPCNRAADWIEVKREIARLHQQVEMLLKVAGVPENVTLSQITEIAEADANVRTAEQRTARHPRKR